MKSSTYRTSFTPSGPSVLGARPFRSERPTGGEVLVPTRTGGPVGPAWTGTAHTQPIVAAPDIAPSSRCSVHPARLPRPASSGSDARRSARAARPLPASPAADPETCRFSGPRTIDRKALTLDASLLLRRGQRGPLVVVAGRRVATNFDEQLTRAEVGIFQRID
jgi:hypothetical protein